MFSACFPGWPFCDCFWISVLKCLPKASARNRFRHPFFNSCSTLFWKGVIKGSFARVGLLLALFSLFWIPVGFHCGIEILPFGSRIYKVPADYRRYSPSKNYSSLGPQRIGALSKLHKQRYTKYIHSTFNFYIFVRYDCITQIWKYEKVLMLISASKI